MVTVQDGFLTQRDPVVSDKDIYRFQHKVHLHGIAHHIRQHLRISSKSLRSCSSTASCMGCRLDPGVIAAMGDTGDAVQFFHRKLIIAILNGFVNNLEHTRRIIHKQCTYFLVVLIEEIFLET